MFSFAPHNRAFLYSSATGMQDLGVLPGTTYSNACAIDNAGEVVGSSYNTTVQAGPTGPEEVIAQQRAFVYTPATGMYDIGTLPGDTQAAAYGINASGVVVGESVSSSGAFRAVVYTSAGGMQQLQTLPGTFGSRAWGINSSGQIIGFYETSNSAGPFLYTDLGGHAGPQ